MKADTVIPLSLAKTPPLIALCVRGKEIRNIMKSQELKKLEVSCHSFKSIEVGKSGNLRPEDTNNLPNDKLKNYWINREFQDFLKEFTGIIATFYSKKEGKEKKFLHDGINATLPFLSEFGYSFDRKVHSAISKCYGMLLAVCDRGDFSEKLQRSLARSVNKYVDTILCTERAKFCPNIKRLLTFLSKNCEEQTFKVEEELRLEFQRQSGLSDSQFFGHICFLQRTALNFLEQLYIYPLDSTFPQRPGVYFIYHVGKTQLYEGSQVSPSTRSPVYVGMSTTSIANRLEDHCRKIERASNPKQLTKEEKLELTKAGKLELIKAGKLELTDFMVRFMTVDNKYYAPSIELMLIEYFSPVWNSETMAFSFGNANGNKNLWNRFHIDKDTDTIENVLSNLEI